MNPIAEEIISYYGVSESDDLAHYGMPRRSGRYPWGSGKDPHQHSRDFIARVDKLKERGWEPTPENIRKQFNMTTTEYQREYRYANDERKLYNIARVKSLKSDGYNRSEIARMMGVNESTIRGWENPNAEGRLMAARNTAKHIKEQVDKHGMVEVGAQVELELGISRAKLDEAIMILEKEGYVKYRNRIPQPTNPGQTTTQTILCKPGTKYSEIYDPSKIRGLNEDSYTSPDNGESFVPSFVYPKSMDSSRLHVRYADEVGPDGARGIDKDGLIEIRRGVADLSLGDARYSQVRILVDDTKYLKGMAVYSDDMPDGVDVVFNTNKQPKKGEPLAALKNIKHDDPMNPFGSAIKEDGGQSYYDGPDGKKHLSLINKRADEGDWSDWSNALPSQFLSKQSKELAQKQLDIAKVDRQSEYEAICALENPTVKKYYLKEFASSCDGAAAHLKAAALPGQKYHVMIPINTLKDNEVYAPNYKDGTKLALVRYPHGGTFEIPILTVNNRNPLARKVLDPDVTDAVGVNSAVASRLSGADFDGDTVMCIPTHDSAGRVHITSREQLPKLVGFDPHMEYAEREGMRHMTKRDTQREMGMITNLINDMTLAAAPDDDLADAVRHSMVVIDAEKHHLDYKRSELDHNIAGLKKKYQRKVDPETGEIHIGGASTLLSRASANIKVLKTQGEGKINTPGKPWYDPSRPEGALVYTTAFDAYYTKRKKYDKDTGMVTYVTADGKKFSFNLKDKAEAAKYMPDKPKIDPETGEVTIFSKNGKVQYRVDEHTVDRKTMDTFDDPYDLVSADRHPMELIYADYAQSMKAMANQARKEILVSGKTTRKPEVAREYAEEVASLNEKLKTALLNRPKERAAIRRATAEVNAMLEATPSMKDDKSSVKKAKQRAMKKAREEVGSVKRRDRNITITDREWEAIQKGAISESTLMKILENTDPDQLRQRAMPRQSTTLSTGTQARIKAMSASYTTAQIAEALNLSTSTVSKYLKGES